MLVAALQNPHPCRILSRDSWRADILGFGLRDAVLARILGVFEGGGEVAVLAAALTAISRLTPAIAGRPEPGPYGVA